MRKPKLSLNGDIDTIFEPNITELLPSRRHRLHQSSNNLTSWRYRQHPTSSNFTFMETSAALNIVEFYLHEDIGSTKHRRITYVVMEASAAPNIV
ncbi:hypothetical protein TNCV_1711381 [Trichonephila clavipes]|nr:hypothetical protein TNCV_1711381 [Trichonephila clavipes]